ncbi:MATE family efflux transporter [bacterium D16-51]|nr:MATE family efflux transporter [bacterium D16-59]RKI59401.1 MATE family efflux transporter [bacterium D16-51]
MEKDKLLFSNRDLWKLILPMILEQMLAVLVGLADTVMVASVGEAAVASVSLVDNINILLISVFAALATGGAVVAGQFMGHGDDKKACRAGEQLVIFMAVFSVVIMALLYLCKGFVLNVVFGKIEPEVMEYSNTYLMIVTASIPFIALYNCGAAIFRVQGNSMISMMVSLLMNAINVAGNAVLIFGFHCKVEGVAIPTLVSRAVAAVVIVILLRRQDLKIHLSRPFRPSLDGNMIRRILQIGVPNGVENSMFQLGKIVLLSLISGFGTVAITANAVSNAVAAFAILPGQSLGMALVTVVSQCVGAQDYRQVRYYTKKLMIFTYVAMAFTNLVILFGIPVINQAYQLSEETAALTRQILVFHSICAIVIWPVSFTLPNTLRAASDAKYTMIVSLLSMWLCRIVLAFLLGKYAGMELFGIWVAMVIDWCVRSVFFCIRYGRGKWEERKIVF